MMGNSLTHLSYRITFSAWAEAHPTLLIAVFFAVAIIYTFWSVSEHIVGLPYIVLSVVIPITLEIICSITGKLFVVYSNFSF